MLKIDRDALKPCAKSLIIKLALRYKINFRCLLTLHSRLNFTKTIWAKAWNPPENFRWVFCWEQYYKSNYKIR